MTPIITRLHGVKRATSVCVGETHLLVLCALYHPVYPSKSDECHLNPMKDSTESEELDEEILFDGIHTDISPKAMQSVSIYAGDVPSLKCLCEKVAAEFLVEPKNAIQLLEIADSLEAEDLRKHCELYATLIMYSLSLHHLLQALHLKFWPSLRSYWIQDHWSPGVTVAFPHQQLLFLLLSTVMRRGIMT